MALTYIVLRPDPVHYYFRHFRRFPVLVFGAEDTPGTYWDGLNADPGGSPADSVGSNWYECVILPESRRWFVHALQSSEDNGGHLLYPSKWRERLAAERGFR